ncbi:MAG: flagellar motor protein MotB [Gammaproteobacteria bacterium]
MSAAKGYQRPIIIVKKRRAEGAAHHGGAWKVAYADFVTAMMAFFLVLWLVTSISKEQRAAVFDYFKNPSMEPGKSSKPAPGQMGPGGASTSPINLGGGLDAPRTTQSVKPGPGAMAPPSIVPSKDNSSKLADAATIAAEAQAFEKAQTELEKKRMEALMDQLKEAIGKSQALEPFKDQLLLDITPEGLRIQIVDAQNRPMFDIGSSKLKSYTATILHELTPYLSSVPNRISLTGHTDTTPYAGITGYTNWDLSTDRANAARRALEGSGLATDRVSRVVGLSSSVLFDRTNPRNPINRRISIVVLTKEAEQEALKTDIPLQPGKASGDIATGDGTPADLTAAPIATTATAPSTGPALAANTSGTVQPIDKPINPPMGAAPAPVPASATTMPPAAAAAAPRHPLPVSKAP